MHNDNNTRAEGQSANRAGVVYNGKFCELWGGVNINTSSESFARGALHNLSRTLKAENHYASVVVQNNYNMSKPKFRIRKLTPRECFRLMDVEEEQIDAIQAYPLRKPYGVPYKEWYESLSDDDKAIIKKKGISKSQQYRQAGNSIVVSCMVELFRNLFRKYPETEQAEPAKAVQAEQPKKPAEITQLTFDF